jgi:YfiH family protein
MPYWRMVEEPLRHWRLEEWPGAVAWFVGRQGGVSLPPYATLNVGRSVRDLEPAVRENRRRAEALGAPGRPVRYMRLAHGAAVHWLAPERELPVADAVFVEDGREVLAVTFADCLPIWLMARTRSVGGLVHAGWRGTVADVAGRAVRELKRAGVAPHEIVVALGPGIGPCCYEVDERVAGLVRALAGGEAFLLPSGPGRYRLDLPGLNRHLLEQAGVLPEHITDAGLCTGCRLDWFFSHRREGGRTGRMGGYLWLTGN